VTVQAALLADIGAVKSGSGFGAFSSANGGSGGNSFELIFWIVFAVVMVLIGVGSPFYGAWLIRKIGGTTGPLQDGLPGTAVIETIADTGMTVTMSSVGANAPSTSSVFR